MEYLSLLFEIDHLEGKLMATYKNDPVISHLLYVNGLLVFAKATVNNAHSIKGVMQKLENHAGLWLNEQKYKILFSKGARMKTDIAKIPVVEIQNLPITYLGIALSSSSLKRADFNNLIDKVKKRLNGWNGKLLILSGRIESIKTIIHSIVYLWMQICRMPINVMNQVDSIYANFLWRGEKRLISWNTICKPKKEGGMGL